jgi:hypothetical protein
LVRNQVVHNGPNREDLGHAGKPNSSSEARNSLALQVENCLCTGSRISVGSSLARRNLRMGFLGTSFSPASEQILSPRTPVPICSSFKPC